MTTTLPPHDRHILTIVSPHHHHTTTTSQLPQYHHTIANYTATPLYPPKPLHCHYTTTTQSPHHHSHTASTVPPHHNRIATSQPPLHTPCISCYLCTSTGPLNHAIIPRPHHTKIPPYHMQHAVRQTLLHQVVLQHHTHPTCLSNHHHMTATPAATRPSKHCQDRHTNSTVPQTTTPWPQHFHHCHTTTFTPPPYH